MIYFTLPKEKTVTKKIQNNEVIHIAPIQIPSTPEVDTAETTLANLKEAISSFESSNNISPEEEAKEVLLTLKETIKPITNTEKPKKETSDIKKDPIKTETLKIEKVVKVEKKIHQAIKPKAPKETVTSKTNVQESKVEKEIDMDNLPFVQTLGVVETKEYIVEPQKEVHNKEAYDGAGTAKFNKLNEGNANKEELEHLEFVQTLGVVEIGEL